MAGRQVYSFNKELKPVGHYSIIWNGKNSNGNKVAPGSYVCQIVTNNSTHSAQFILTK
jgi:flagellar hook assembly protein FlgD